jgi:hypothetical protein
LAKHSDIRNANTRFKALWLSPLTRIQIPLLFLRSLSILSGCPIINIHSCHQYRKLSWFGPMETHPHTGFHYSKLLTHLSYDYVRFINISVMDLGGCVYRQILKWLGC